MRGPVHSLPRTSSWFDAQGTKQTNYPINLHFFLQLLWLHEFSKNVSS